MRWRPSAQAMERGSGDLERWIGYSLSRDFAIATRSVVMTNWNAKQHSYEELRTLVIDELLAHTCQNFDELQERVGQGILKRYNQWPRPPRETGIAYQGAVSYLHPYDSSTILEVFWDLFRQGIITLGKDARNPGWPWFRLSRFGENIKNQSEFRFHDTSSYMAMIKSYDPDISPEAMLYLEEAAASFYAECLLSALIMLGVAAEAEFLVLSMSQRRAHGGAQFSLWWQKRRLFGEKFKNSKRLLLLTESSFRVK